jgi:pilus assembly protein CpaB
MKLLKNRIFISILCLLMAAVLAFVLLPRLYKAQSSTTEIVRLNQTVERGTVIDETMLTVTEAGAYGLPDKIITEKAEVVGLVAAATGYAGEYLWRDRFVSAEEYALEATGAGELLTEGKYLLTVSLPTASAGVAGVLRGGDVVDVFEYVTDELGNAAVSKVISDLPVYEVLNGNLLPLDELDARLEEAPDTDAADYDFAPAYVVFIADEQQAKTLIRLEREKSMHLTLTEAGE